MDNYKYNRMKTLFSLARERARIILDKKFRKLF